jgi:hypothetical protein
MATIVHKGVKLVCGGAVQGARAAPGRPAAAQSSPPHVAVAPQRRQWLDGGAGHFNMMEAPDQVTSMIEGFLRHYV